MADTYHGTNVLFIDKDKSMHLPFRGTLDRWLSDRPAPRGWRNWLDWRDTTSSQSLFPRWSLNSRTNPSPATPSHKRTEQLNTLTRDAHGTYKGNDQDDGYADDNNLLAGYAAGRRPVVAGDTFFVITRASKNKYADSCHSKRLGRDYMQYRQRAHSYRIGGRTRLVNFHFSARNSTRTDAAHRSTLYALHRSLLSLSLSLSRLAAYFTKSNRNSGRSLSGGASAVWLTTLDTRHTKWNAYYHISYCRSRAQRAECRVPSERRLRRLGTHSWSPRQRAARSAQSVMRVLPQSQSRRHVCDAQHDRTRSSAVLRGERPSTINI